MTILRIAVEDEQVGALKHLLQSVSFVKDVQEERTVTESDELLIARVRDILAATKGQDLFTDIEDPVEWQRELRKEWERDI